MIGFKTHSFITSYLASLAQGEFRFMNKRIFLLLALLFPVSSVFSQEVAPGEGLPIIEGNISGSINIGSLNPLRCNATDCGLINSLMFPSLIGINPESGYYAPMGRNGLVKDWQISEDGLEYTFNLRDDVFWTDGEQVNADDVVFTFGAILSNEIESSYSAALLDSIKGIKKVDEFTVEASLQSTSCTALNNLSSQIIPEHVFTDFADMVDHNFDRNPSVSSGIFKFGQLTAGERITLLANQDYAFAEAVYPQGYIFVDAPNSSVAFERFLAGEFNIIGSTPGVPTENRAALRERKDDFQLAEWASSRWTYIGLNVADPTNPQPAFDEAGKRIDQGEHPLFGDRNVRRALQHAINVQDIINGALFGEAVQMASAELPNSWALNPDLAPIPFDPSIAANMLDAAGFPLNDKGLREATEEALFAEAGTPFKFELIVPNGTEEFSRIGTLVQDQLRELGITVVINSVDFNTAIGLISSQGYEAYLLGWVNGFPVDPDLSFIFSAESDNPPYGFNNTSYYNGELFDLIQAARTLPGCDQAERADLYHEIQAILQHDQPYLWLFAHKVMAAASNGMTNFDPLPQQVYWNVENWKYSGP